MHATEVFPGGTSGKEPACPLAGDVRDVGSAPVLEDPLEEGTASLQYSCLENPMDRGDWSATVRRIVKSRT